MTTPGIRQQSWGVRKELSEGPAESQGFGDRWTWILTSAGLCLLVWSWARPQALNSVILSGKRRYYNPPCQVVTIWATNVKCPVQSQAHHRSSTRWFLCSSHYWGRKNQDAASANHLYYQCQVQRLWVAQHCIRLRTSYLPSKGADDL